ncbi:MULTISPECIES: DUF2292 domain-containing protein [Bacillaceae]
MLDPLKYGSITLVIQQGGPQE